MAVTKKQAKQAVDKNNDSAKKSGKKPGKQATSGNVPAKKDSKKEIQAKKRPGKISAARSYLTGVLNEMKKVHWPNRREATIYTSVVLVAVVVVSALIWIFDLLLSGLLRLIY